MDELDKNKIDKYTKLMREMEEYFRAKGDTSVHCTREQIEALYQSGKIPEELWEHHCRSTKEISDRIKLNKKIMEENPHLSSTECLEKMWPSRTLSPDEVVKQYEDAALSSMFLKCLLENEEFINKDSSFYEDLNKTLFKDVNINEDFGIVRAITDSLYHLENVLKDMKYSQFYENQYIAKGSFTNSKGESISLEYAFRATSDEDAKTALAEYKNTMLKKGLRTWMAYWCAANEKSRFEYTCTLTELMKWTADENRDSYFQTKEKEEFWALTKMLNQTKLSRSRLISRKTKKGEKNCVQWIEQPLVEICGGERLEENEDKYPEALAVRVLMPNLGKKGFVPAIFKIATLKLNPNDIYLAYIIQVRANQMERGQKELFFNWDSLFEIGNLHHTARSNIRMAKAKIRGKMIKLKEGQIIEDSKEDLFGMKMKPRKTKAKSIDSANSDVNK